MFPASRLCCERCPSRPRARAVRLPARQALLTRWASAVPQCPPLPPPPTRPTDRRAVRLPARQGGGGGAGRAAGARGCRAGQRAPAVPLAALPAAASAPVVLPLAGLGAARAALGAGMGRRRRTCGGGPATRACALGPRHAHAALNHAARHRRWAPRPSWRSSTPRWTASSRSCAGGLAGLAGQPQPGKGAGLGLLGSAAPRWTASSRSCAGGRAGGGVGGQADGWVGEQAGELHAGAEQPCTAGCPPTSAPPPTLPPPPPPPRNAAQRAGPAAGQAGCNAGAGGWPRALAGGRVPQRAAGRRRRAAPKRVPVGWRCRAGRQPSSPPAPCAPRLLYRSTSSARRSWMYRSTETSRNSTAPGWVPGRRYRLGQQLLWLQHYCRCGVASSSRRLPARPRALVPGVPGAGWLTRPALHPPHNAPAPPSQCPSPSTGGGGAHHRDGQLRPGEVPQGGWYCTVLASPPRLAPRLRPVWVR